MFRSLFIFILFLGTLPASFSRGAENDGVAQQLWWRNALSRPATPQVKGSSWVRNPIDAFILAKLEAAKLHPAARADKITLIRRATYDLIGLPPTPAEVHAFIADGS